MEHIGSHFLRGTYKLWLTSDNHYEAYWYHNDASVQNPLASSTRYSLVGWLVLNVDTFRWFTCDNVTIIGKKQMDLGKQLQTHL